MSSKRTESESPLAKPLPVSPKMSKLRQEVAKVIVYYDVDYFNIGVVRVIQM